MNILINKIVNLEPRQKQQIIPLNIYLTWNTTECSPKMTETIQNIIIRNPEFKIEIHLLDSCREFIKTNFAEMVLKTYDKLIPIEYKSDLWKYCILYANGGIYLDMGFYHTDTDTDNIDFKFADYTDKEYFTKTAETNMINGCLIIVKPRNENIFNFIIKIVNNVNMNYYGFDKSSITGSLLLQEIIGNNREHETFDFVLQTIDNVSHIQFQNKTVLKRYPEYKTENISNYAELWNNKAVYDTTNDFKTIFRNICISNIKNIRHIEIPDFKTIFRNICISNIKNIRHIEIPDIKPNGHFYESVIVEFRKLPHLEFLIRNMCIKLGEHWAHTVICGTLNYEFIKEICSDISPKIHIIKLGFENINQSEYSKILVTTAFWDLLQGEKILIYQEDSCIFKTNINDFLQYDFIGASLPKNQNDTKSGVGNGGFSLRSKSVMKYIIKTINIKDMVFNSSTIDYKNFTLSLHYPEDIYFCKNMEDLKIGVLPTREIADMFSIEFENNETSLGGHCWWYNNEDKWTERLFETII
jgi:mannosyltransferase OCH1-like enzyme